MSAQAALTTFGDASGARFYAGESWVELARSLIMTSADANEVEHAIQRAHEYAEQTGGRLLSARVIEAQARLAAREGHTDVSLMRLCEAAEALAPHRTPSASSSNWPNRRRCGTTAD